MPSISGKMDSEEEDMDQDTPDSDKSDSRSSHSGSGSDEEESSGMKQLNLSFLCSFVTAWVELRFSVMFMQPPFISGQNICTHLFKLLDLNIKKIM